MNTKHGNSKYLLPDGRAMFRQILGHREWIRSTRRYKYSPEYHSWQGMWFRCTAPSSSEFKNYGGRGIKICERWRDFELFLEDMGPRPEGKSLDRIDTNGDYTPENCEWSTYSKQARTRRPNGKVKYIGVCRRGNKYLAQISFKDVGKFHLGVFDCPIAASRAYKRAYKWWYGEEYSADA